MFGVTADQFFPVLYVIFLAEDASHVFEGVANLEVVHCETGEAFAKEFLEMVFVSVPKEVQVACVLVDLPSSQDVF